MEAIARDLKLALNLVSFANELGFNPDPWQERVLRRSQDTRDFYEALEF